MMNRHGLCTRKGGGGAGSRLGARALSAVAAISLAASMYPAAALAYASDHFTTDAGTVELIGNTSTALVDDAAGEALVEQEDSGLGAITPVTSDTHYMTSGLYSVTGDVTIGPDDTGNGIRIEKGAKVTLHLNGGATLTVTGRGATGTGIGHAAILLPNTSELIVSGRGTLNATGGRAGDGAAGNNAAESWITEDNGGRTGNGGAGGAGGGGGGAGIGTDGGAGGTGGTGGEGASCGDLTRENIYGNGGKAGSSGFSAENAGKLLVTGAVTVNGTGGAGGSAGASGSRGKYNEVRVFGIGTAVGTSGGGGGGAGGSAGDGIGSGGTGGGGGGGGASGNIDGEAAFFYACDLDDLWGHSGSGGSGSWGGAKGNNGDEGASNGGDDTGASRSYAKGGGQAGFCSTPVTVAFYTYKESESSNPQCTSTSGHGVVRNATPLDTLQPYTDFGGYVDVSGGTFAYDGRPHGASVNTTDSIDAQAEGDGANSGTLVVDGVEVTYSISYYDGAGNRLDAEPVMPGRYAAVVTFAGDKADYCGDWVETITIAKTQVAVPTPMALTFECEDWETGKGVEQDAFLESNSADYEFVVGALSGDDIPSLRSAGTVGTYWACFRLTDPETCEWADGSGSSEVWVPWSIAPASYDLNSAEFTYWGSAHDNASTSVAHTGQPIWVRPWFAPTRGEGGEFPDWLTHWGDAGRPTDDRCSAVVVYQSGEEDQEGLVGYHENGDGSLEPVTGAQVYAWMYGMKINGTHVDVESGDKIWYHVGDDECKVPLAVQSEEPEGADGYFIARDLAYVTHLGVRDPGTYSALAIFDEDSGFATTSVAEATVVVSRTQEMFRLYNPNSGEHFYTADAAERDHLASLGWAYEGVGWLAPMSGDPVHRLYNPNAGDHHYTMDEAERDSLVREGWNYEGVGWHSDPARSVTVYREYNPNAYACNHNYTSDREEHDGLVALGWHDEGIGWYGVTAV